MKSNPILKEILDWILHIAIAILAGIFIVTFIAQRTIVDGSSMLPTLHDGDQLIVEKITPRLSKLKRGDVVTLYIPELLEEGKEYVVKRIIALEGDTVEIMDGKVFVNGEQLEEEYINGNNTYAVNSEYSHVVVPEGHVYVLGDNRLPNASYDSRSFGPIDLDKITGKMLIRYYPFGKKD
jgi:signal peptidase I